MPFFVAAFLSLAVSQVAASSLGVGVLKELASGERRVWHGYVVFENVTLESKYWGVDDVVIERVYFTAYVKSSLDSGYYYVRVKLVNGDESYIARGTVYLTSTPSRFYFDLDTGTFQDDKVKVILDAKRVG